MNLLVFLSDRCNMACDYCFLALNGSRPTVLDERAGLAALERHLAAYKERARVTLLGGEPLLHPDLAWALARRAREAGAKTSLVTNGLKASPEVVSRLLDAGAEVTVSIDGGASSHDAHRRMLGGAGSHSRLVEALDRLDPARLRANLVVSPDTAPSLLSGLEWLRARGLRRVSFHAAVDRAWPPQALESFAAALEGVLRYARALRAASPRALEIAHLDSFRAPRPVEAGDELVLGADGRYYANDAYLCRPYGEGLEGAIGDVASGPDLRKREELLAAAVEGSRRAIGGRPCYTSPVETWLLARLRGRDADAAARAFNEADSLLGDALSRLARESEAGVA